MPTHFILGGARSGKSAYAERLASALEQPVTYIATAQMYDDEFVLRVAQHQSRRPVYWGLVEAPFHLAKSLQTQDAPDTCLIVDCLTLWLAQCICPECNKTKDSPKYKMDEVSIDWQTEKNALLAILPSLQAQVFLVSNEVGMGIVPLGEINRQFQDEQGRLNQAIAAAADKVTLMAAGLPLLLKGSV